MHQPVFDQSQDRKRVNSPKWISEKNIDTDNTDAKMKKPRLQSPSMEDVIYHALKTYCHNDSYRWQVVLPVILLTLLSCSASLEAVTLQGKASVTPATGRAVESASEAAGPEGTTVISEAEHWGTQHIVHELHPHTWKPAQRLVDLSLFNNKSSGFGLDKPWYWI